MRGKTTFNPPNNMKKAYFFLLFLTVLTSATAKDRADKLRENLIHNPKYVTVVAHRGDWRGAPENSLQAYQNCIEMGVDMIEIDIHKTKDGVLVIMHDETLNRTSNGKGKISEHTYSEIQTMGLRAQHDAWITRHKIPTLEEVLNLCKGKILINIDKGYDYFQDVLALTEKTGTTHQIIIKSSKMPEQVMHENADVLSKAIYMPIVHLDAKNAAELVENNLKLKPVAIECCIGKYSEQVEALLQQIRAAGVKVWINSIWPSLCDGHDDDRAVEMKDPDGAWGWILARGATLIQTDRPSQLIQYLRQHKAHKLK